MPFKYEALSIKGVYKITASSFPDNRGYFMEAYKSSDFFSHGIGETLIQDNLSLSKKGVLRGLHFQKEPNAQGKLVQVLKGKIFDVAVDVRKKSESFGKWVGEILSEKNHSMLWVPKGFAHGFLAIEESYVNYKVSSEYNKESEAGIIWNDPAIGITWPIDDPILSEKDRKYPTLDNCKELF